MEILSIKLRMLSSLKKSTSLNSPRMTNITEKNDWKTLVELAKKNSRHKGVFDEEFFGASLAELIFKSKWETRRLERVIKIFLESSDLFQNEIGCYMLSSSLLTSDQKAGIINELIETDSFQDPSLSSIILEGLRNSDIGNAEFFERVCLTFLGEGNVYAATGPLVACLQRNTSSADALLTNFISADMNEKLPPSTFSATACLISDAARFMGLSKISWLIRLSDHWPKDVADYFLRQMVCGFQRIEGLLNESDKKIVQGLLRRQP